MVFLRQIRGNKLFWALLFLSFLLFLFTLTSPIKATANIILEEEAIDPLFEEEPAIHDSNTFLESISKPTAEFKIFYQLTNLTHWPFQYILGDLGVKAGRIIKPKVVVLVYTSLSCLHCSDLHLQTLRPLQTKYANEICIIVRDRPLDLFSLQASLLTYCHPQKTHHLQKILFEKQADWMPEMGEIMNLNREDAHKLIKKRLLKIAQQYGYTEKCQPYFSFEMLQQAAQMMSQHQEFKKILSTPIVYLYVPEKKKTTQVITYATPREIPLQSLEFKALEKIINIERAKLFT